MSLKKYSLGCDTFIRHWLVSALAGEFNPETILDVGGEGTLSLFLPQAKITTANIKQADIVSFGTRLPLKDNSFDLVVSLDTVEHLPKDRRKDFNGKSILIPGPLSGRFPKTGE